MGGSDLGWFPTCHYSPDGHRSGTCFNQAWYTVETRYNENNRTFSDACEFHVALKLIQCMERDLEQERFPTADITWNITQIPRSQA